MLAVQRQSIQQAWQHKVTPFIVQSVVLPRVMEQIVQCKDNIAQQYLMQCLIQGFPDEFHVSTLDVLLGALPELQGTVKVHVILASMLDRLARYALPGFFNYAVVSAQLFFSNH